MIRWLAAALWALRGRPFRVVYADGQISQEMRRGAARGYAQIFGGTVRPACDFERRVVPGMGRIVALRARREEERC